MKRVVYLILVAAFLSIVAASASLCDNAPCEKAINVTIGENFTIPLQFHAGTGFEWWTQFDPAFLALEKSSENAKNSGSGMVGLTEEKAFTFNAKMSGSTDVIMLLLRPWKMAPLRSARYSQSISLKHYFIKNSGRRRKFKLPRKARRWESKYRAQASTLRDWRGLYDKYCGKKDIWMQMRDAHLDSWVSI